MLNRRAGALHLCREHPCTHGEVEGLVHIAKARWFDRKEFNEDYMKAWGKLVINPPVRRGALKRHAARKPPEREGAKPGAKRGRRKPPREGS